MPVELGVLLSCQRRDDNDAYPRLQLERSQAERLMPANPMVANGLCLVTDQYVGDDDHTPGVVSVHSLSFSDETDPRK